MGYTIPLPTFQNLHSRRLPDCRIFIFNVLMILIFCLIRDSGPDTFSSSSWSFLCHKLLNVLILDLVESFCLECHMAYLNLNTSTLWETSSSQPNFNIRSLSGILFFCCPGYWANNMGFRHCHCH